MKGGWTTCPVRHVGRTRFPSGLLDDRTRTTGPGAFASNADLTCERKVAGRTFTPKNASVLLTTFIHSYSERPQVEELSGEEMGRRLCIVEDTFTIAGRGLTFIPGIVPAGDERFYIGDPILLKRPDGSSIQTSIAGIGLVGGAGHAADVPVLLRGLTKEDVPIGTEVWSVGKGF